MTGSDYLRRIRVLDAEIANLNAEINDLYGIRAAAGYDVPKVNGSGIAADQTAETAVKIITLETKRDRLLSEWIDLYRTVSDLLELLPDVLQRIVLVSRYVLGQKWEDVAKDAGYSTKNTFRIHKKALQEFEKLWKGTANTRDQ